MKSIVVCGWFTGNIQASTVTCRYLATWGPEEAFVHSVSQICGWFELASVPPMSPGHWHLPPGLPGDAAHAAAKPSKRFFKSSAIRAVIFATGGRALLPGSIVWVCLKVGVPRQNGQFPLVFL